MGELRALVEEHRSWLQQPRWRCSTCHQSCNCRSCCENPVSTPRRNLPQLASTFLPGVNKDDDLEFERHGPCEYPGCNGQSGVYQMRNLYEVNAEIIMPRCADTQVSYVELLRLEEAAQLQTDDGYVSPEGVPVDTFVSHWWGEEFPSLVKTLKKLAKFRCAGRCIHQRHFTDWAFWICAFANNQYAVDHAIGIGGNVAQSAFAVALQNCQEMVAVIDPEAEIYRRIWCAFELFYADSLPHRPRILLANQRGIFSAGAASAATVQQMRALLSTVRVSEAKATVEADRLMIMNALAEAGVSTDMLDQLLRKQVHEGLRMVWLRGNFFAIVACEFLCGLSCVILAGSLCMGVKYPDFVTRYSWYIEWFLLLHIPPLCGACIFGAFIAVLSYCGEEGRNTSVDSMWWYAHRDDNSPVSQVACLQAVAKVVLVSSTLAAFGMAIAELSGAEVPRAGEVHDATLSAGGALQFLLLVELFARDVVLVPRRLRRRLVFYELSASIGGMLAGLWVLRDHTGAFVAFFAAAAWLGVVYSVYLRDRCQRLRRRIEEPLWS